VLSVLRGTEAVGTHDKSLCGAVLAVVYQLTASKLFPAENVGYTTLKMNDFLLGVICEVCSKSSQTHVVNKQLTLCIWKKRSLRGRLHGAFYMCVSMSDKPFDAEACDIGGRASPTNGCDTRFVGHEKRTV
jgi:hypothetical protein